MLAIFMSFIPNIGVRAEEDKEVKIYFDGDGLLPAAGNKIDTGFQVKAQDGGAAHCKIVDAIDGFTDGVQWKTSEGKLVKKGDVFVKDTQYSLFITIRPDSDYIINTDALRNYTLKVRNYYLPASSVVYDNNYKCYVVKYLGGECLYAFEGWSELNLRVDTPIAGKQIYDKLSYASTKPTNVYSENNLNEMIFVGSFWSESKNGKDGWRYMEKDESFKKGYYYHFIGVNASNLLRNIKEDFYTFGGLGSTHAISQNFKVSLNGVVNTGFNTDTWSNKGYIDFGQCREEVDTIGIDITMPVAGAAPKWEGNLTSDKYSLVKNGNEYVSWYDETANENLKSGDKFIAGHKYIAQFEVQPGSLTRWAPTTTLIVNGKAALSVNGKIKEESKKTSPIKFEVPVNCPSMQELYLYGMEKYPVIGEKINKTDKDELIIEDPILKISDVYPWKTKNEAGEYESATGKFKEGVTYYLPIKVSYYSDSSVVFPTLIQNDDFEINVEGADKAFIYESEYPYNAITIYAEFTPRKAASSIDIKGYKVPAIEDKITYDGLKADTASHFVIDESYNNSWFKKGVAWGEIVDGSEILFANNLENEFYEGHEYVMQLLVKPAYGYAIPSDIKNIKASIQGNEAEVRTSEIPGHLLIVLKKKPVGRITRVDFQMSEPVAGQSIGEITITTVPKNAIKDTEFYKDRINSLWGVSDSDDENTFSAMKEGEIFEVGKYYSFPPGVILLYGALLESSKPGSVLDNSIAAGFSQTCECYLNGKAFDISKYVIYGPLTGDISRAEVTGIKDMDYTGNAITQDIKVTFAGKALVEGTDYKIEYKDNKEVGTAKVIISGIGNYKEILEKTFKITSAGSSDPSKPTDPSDPTDPTKPTDPTTPVDPSNPTNPTDPSNPTNPSNPDKTPEGIADEGTELATLEAVVTETDNDKDLAGAEFGKLQAKASKVTKNSIKLSWNKVNGADGYIIYGNKCSKNNKYVKIKELSSSKKTFTQKKLKKGTYYKYLVVAVKNENGKQVVVSTSKTIHAATAGGKVGNAKQIKIKNVSGKKKTLKQGKSFTLKTKQIAEKKSLKIKNHRKLSFETSNPAVATVNSKGKIKAVGKGSCDIYVYAQNGVSVKLTFTIK